MSKMTPEEKIEIGSIVNNILCKQRTEEYLQKYWKSKEDSRVISDFIMSLPVIGIAVMVVGAAFVVGMIVGVSL